MDYVRSVSTSGYFSFQQAIVPNRWQGECNCVVGPFSSKHIAEHYVNAVVDFGHFESFSRRVFAKGDSWFVEVQEA